MSYELRMERLFDAPLEVVFDTYVDPDAQEEMWDNMVPGWRLLESEIDLRVGGTWKLAFGPPGGKPDRVTSVFTEIDRPHRLVTQESTYVSELDATTNTTVTLTFEEQAAGRSSGSFRPASRPSRSAMASRADGPASSMRFSASWPPGPR